MHKCRWETTLAISVIARYIRQRPAYAKFMIVRLRNDVKHITCCHYHICIIIAINCSSCAVVASYSRYTLQPETTVAIPTLARGIRQNPLIRRDRCPVSNRQCFKSHCGVHWAPPLENACCHWRACTWDSTTPAHPLWSQLISRRNWCNPIVVCQSRTYISDSTHNRLCAMAVRY